MDNNFLKITSQEFQNFLEINNALSNIETKGDSTITICKIRIALSSMLEQIKKNNEINQQEEQPIVVDKKDDKK